MLETGKQTKKKKLVTTTTTHNPVSSIARLQKFYDLYQYLSVKDSESIFILSLCMCRKSQCRNSTTSTSMKTPNTIQLKTFGCCSNTSLEVNE